MTGYRENQLIHIEPIEAFKDNYIWLIHNNKNSIVVDPGDANPVIETLERKSLGLIAILITHHHADHIGGVRELQKNIQILKFSLLTKINMILSIKALKTGMKLIFLNFK